MVYFDLLQGFRNKYQLPAPVYPQIHQYRQFSLCSVFWSLFQLSVVGIIILNSLSNRKHVFMWSPLIPVKGTSLCIFSSIWECDPRFWTHFQFFKLLIMQLVVIATCLIWISRGNNPVITTKVAVGEVRIAPVIARHANLSTRDSIALATPSSTRGHHTNAACVIIGLMIAMYIQWHIFGLIPHVLPTILRHCQNSAVAFSHFWSRCSLHVSLLSRMTPRYLTLFVLSSSLPKNTIGINPGRVLFLVKRTISVLSGLTERPWSSHHLWTLM